MNKKKLLKIVLPISLVCICLIVVLIICLCSFVSCGPSKSTKEISLTDYSGKTTLTIKKSFKNVVKSGHVIYFDIAEEEALEDIKVAVNEISDANYNYETSIKNDVLLVSVVSDYTAYFGIKQYSGNRYVLSDLSATVYNDEKQAMFLLPYHLCDFVKEESTLMHSFNDNDLIVISEDYSQWKQFYKSANKSGYKFDDTNTIINLDDCVRLTFSEGKVLVEVI